MHLLAFGASTPIGRDAWSSAAAVRAGVAGFRQHPYMVDRAGEPMRVAPAPWLDVDLTGVERFEALLYPALDQAVAPLQGSPPLRAALALGLPAPRPGFPAGSAQRLGARVAERYGRLLDASARFDCGHAAALVGLDAALRKLRHDELDVCIVAGVDSYLEPETLEWLESREQLHGAGALNDAWGFVPGEGAGAVLLAGERGVAALGVQRRHGRLLGVGLAFEPKTIDSGEVCLGAGLTAALRATLDALPRGLRVSDVYCDMNGEPYRADEFGFSGLRVGTVFESLSDFVAPADCWGDVGAAGVPLHLTLAAVAQAKRYAHGALALVFASSPSGERAAALLAAGS